jgi:hypothetical protein
LQTVAPQIKLPPNHKLERPIICMDWFWNGRLGLEPREPDESSSRTAKLETPAIPESDGIEVGACLVLGASYEAPARNFRTWSAAPATHLQALVCAIEPSTFSMANLKCLMKKGQRQVPKPPLLELLERCCDLDPDAEIGPDRMMDVVIAKFMSINDTLGRRGRDLMLPADWATDGFYLVTMTGGEVWLVDRETMVKIKVFTYTADQQPSVWSIDLNFSKHRARLLGEPDVALPRQCMLYFKTESSIQPAAKRQRGGSSAASSTRTGSSGTPTTTPVKVKQEPADDVKTEKVSPAHATVAAKEGGDQKLEPTELSAKDETDADDLAEHPMLAEAVGLAEEGPQSRSRRSCHRLRRSEHGVMLHCSDVLIDRAVPGWCAIACAMHVITPGKG